MLPRIFLRLLKNIHFIFLKFHFCAKTNISNIWDTQNLVKNLNWKFFINDTSNTSYGFCKMPPKNMSLFQSQNCNFQHMWHLEFDYVDKILD